MTRRTIGVLAGVVSSAVGAWYWIRRHARHGQTARTSAGERGRVIFDNTPKPAAGGQSPLP